MFVSPLIKPLKAKGGTLYVFPSASKDIAKTFSDDDFRFVFDRFALLNLPDVKTPVNDSNNIVWENIGALPSVSSIPVPPGLNASENVNFALALQNYCFNFESLILSSQNTLSQPFDETLKRTVSERVFWKFLKETNAIRFDESTSDISNVSDRWNERSMSIDPFYSKVVQYIGDIDLVNSVNRDGNSYTEVYIHVATQCGSTPEILFKTISDNNYFENGSWVGSSEYISGRNASTLHPSGLNVEAWYDDDSADSYDVASTFDDTTDVSKTVNLSGSLSTKNVKISNLDGISIDFDLNSYVRATDSAYVTFEELNRTSASTDFQFNAVLLYYSIYDVTNPSDSVRNLYGILLLDDFVSTLTDGSYIPRIEKNKPNRFIGSSGNSFAFKLNLKFDPYSETIGSEVSINDYSTFSMDLFSDMMTVLQEANSRFSQTLAMNEALFAELNSLKNSLFSSSTSALESRISELESQFRNSNLAISSNTFAVDLLTVLSKRVDDIVTGKISVTPALDLSFLDFGRGISIDRSVPAKAKINSTLSSFSSPSICKNSSGFLAFSFDNGTNPDSVTDGNVLTIGATSTRFRSLGSSVVLNDDLILNLEDLSTSWITGQVFRLVFDHEIDVNGFSIIVFTDSRNKFQASKKYSKLVCSLSNADLISSKPIVEIICINSASYQFEVDILR